MSTQDNTNTGDAMKAVALKLWGAEVAVVQQLPYVIKQEAMGSAKASYTALCAAVDAILGKTISDPAGPLQDLLDQYKAGYLKMLYFVLSKSRSADVRTSVFQHTMSQFEVKWDAIYQELAADGTRLPEVMQGITDVLDKLNVLFGSLSKPLADAINKFRQGNRLDLDVDDIELDEYTEQTEQWAASLEEDVPELKDLFSKGSSYFGFAVLLISVAIAVWDTVLQTTGYAESMTNKLLQIGAGYGTSLTVDAAGEAVGDALSEAVTQAITEAAIEAGVEAAVETTVATAETTVAVVTGLVTFGVGFVVVAVVSAVVDALVSLFWALSESNPMPSLMTVTLTVPMTTESRAPIFANMNASMFGA